MKKPLPTTRQGLLAYCRTDIIWLFLLDLIGIDNGVKA